MKHSRQPRRGRFRLAGLAAFCVLAPGLLAASARATVVPSGFVHERIVGEPFVEAPVGFDFLPDGRFVLIEQESGVVRIAAAVAPGSRPARLPSGRLGSDPPTPAPSDSVFTIPDVNGDHPERGLLGVAVDPAWPARPYFYFHYTSTAPDVRIVLYEASGALSDPQSTAITLGNRFVLLAGIDDDATIHNAGTVRFAPDGSLLVSVGDDSKACEAQDLESPLGKILRIDVSGMPGGGTGPPPLGDLDPGDNPFPGHPGYGFLVSAWGLRNPFRFTVDPMTGDTFVGNVGSSFYEEIELVPGSDNPGPNFAWPQFEGPQELFCCGDCGDGNVFTDAIHRIAHPLGLISVIAGPVLRPVPASLSSVPASYAGDFLYGEFFSGDLVRLRETAGVWDFAPPVAGQPDPEKWGTGFPGVSDLRIGPDGAIHLVSTGFAGSTLPRGLHRIRADSTVVGAPGVGPLPAAGGLSVTAQPNPVRSGVTTIRWAGPVNAEVTVVVVDARGRVIRRFGDGESGTGNAPRNASPNDPGSAGPTGAGTGGSERSAPRSLGWDGRDARGEPVPAGVYFAIVQTESGSGQAKITRLR